MQTRDVRLDLFLIEMGKLWKISNVQDRQGFFKFCSFLDNPVELSFTGLTLVMFGLSGT